MRQGATDVACETGTLPWLTRKRPAEGRDYRHYNLRLAPADRRLSARHSDWALKVIGAAFRAIEPIEDALSAALMNAGPIIHSPLIIMNAGPIGHFDKWDIHNENTTRNPRGP